MIDYLLFSLGIKKPRFIEIGVGDYREANTRFVFERTNCQGLIIDVTKDLEQKVKNLEEATHEIAHMAHMVTKIGFVANNINFVNLYDLIMLVL